MIQLDFSAHKDSSNITPPPSGNLSILRKSIDSYKLWQEYAKHFPKTERFGIGQKISQTFIEVLELIFTASYLSLDQKIVILTKASSRHDILKFFIQIAWENKLLATEKYIAISKQLEEIGRMIGGWRKGLLKKKTPIQ